ncbi:hypothetical protein L9W73_16715 [Vibrio aestuarianus]|uniref:Uncharacterized protein n=1 Tax=Vibrio aestuarianus TaxID=28171 RepID=A0A9X4J5H8_9VIBR|nr:hypothetical protein [Vibrio aestuarianus]MDE1358926.1 hypothetical protein [Vibrio aestuarianus]
MGIDTNWDALSAISTACAAVIALGLGVLPPIFRSISERRLATKRAHDRLKTVQLVIKKYRFYNVQSIKQDGFTQYQYDTSNIKAMTVNIDLYNEAMCLNALSEDLSGEVKVTVTETLDLLVAISSGFPFHSEEWDRLEVLIEQSLNILKNRL